MVGNLGCAVSSLHLRGQKIERRKASKKKLAFEAMGNSPQVADHSDMKFIIATHFEFSNYKSKFNLFSIAYSACFEQN